MDKGKEQGRHIILIRAAATVLLAGMLLQPDTALSAPVPPALEEVARVSSGAQMERAREAMERERIAEQLREGREARGARVEQDAEAEREKAAAVRFHLQKVNMNDSAVLSPEEIAEITGAYIGKEVSLNDLYELVEAINKRYAAKGYMTCRAFLPPQKIYAGEVAIRLVEGRTGTVTFTGNKHTKEAYLAGSFALRAGEIANTDTLARELQHFNASHDAQLRMVMRAGKEPGTTDYEIRVYEPKRNESMTLFTDNSGYDSSGRWREGIYYANRSVSGYRDSLRAYFQHSLGSDAWGLAYSAPLNRHGMKLDLDYSGNQTEIKKGALRDRHVAGNAWALGATLRILFLADRHRRYETGLQLIRQHSSTEFGRHTATRFPLLNDHTVRMIPYLAFTHYGDTSVVYHRHSLARTHRKDITGDSRDTWNYQLGAFYQKRYKSGQLLQARFDGQFASARYQELASSDRFYIGGVNSVRGYEESLLAGEDGLSASLEYHVPLVPANNVKALAFFDYGRIYGETARKDANMLVSAGVGVTASVKDVNASLMLGIPLKREIGGEKVDRARLHFALSATF